MYCILLKHSIKGSRGLVKAQYSETVIFLSLVYFLNQNVFEYKYWMKAKLHHACCHGGKTKTYFLLELN